MGELVYLTSQGLLNSFSLNSDSSTRNDSLLFIFGLATFILLLSLLTHALLRFKPFIASIFRVSHRGLAVMLLLVASAHWWPFAIFLMPAITCGVTSYALRRFHTKDIKMVRLLHCLVQILVVFFCRFCTGMVLAASMESAES